MFRRIDMSHRRSHIEIIVEILRIARKGAKKTRIVYGANLNFKILAEYLERLEEAGLIVRCPDDSGMVKTTEKGWRYLQQYRALKEFGID